MLLTSTETQQGCKRQGKNHNGEPVSASQSSEPVDINPAVLLSGQVNPSVALRVALRVAIHDPQQGGSGTGG